MFRKLKDVPDCLGNIDGVEYEADMNVRITTHPKLREKVLKFLEGIENYEKVDNISVDKEYHVHKIISYGDPFDVCIIDDFGKEASFGEWFFEDVE